MVPGGPGGGGEVVWLGCNMEISLANTLDACIMHDL